MSALPENPVCDFCRSAEVVWLYPCEDFEVPEAAWASQGAWAACDVCSRLIEGHLWRGLAHRVTVSEPDVQPGTPLWVALMDLHRRFNRHRTGPRQAVPGVSGPDGVPGPDGIEIPLDLLALRKKVVGLEEE